MNTSSSKTPQDVKDQFATASFLANDRIVFNIGGNKYRLVLSMRYPKQKVYIDEVFTHAEYDRQTKDGTL